MKPKIPSLASEIRLMSSSETSLSEESLFGESYCIKRPLQREENVKYKSTPKMLQACKNVGNFRSKLAPPDILNSVCHHVQKKSEINYSKNSKEITEIKRNKVENALVKHSTPLKTHSALPQHQESSTCMVLEVLEPSSSDNEDLSIAVQKGIAIPQEKCNNSFQSVKDKKPFLVKPIPKQRNIVSERKSVDRLDCPEPITSEKASGSQKKISNVAVPKQRMQKTSSTISESTIKRSGEQVKLSNAKEKSFNEPDLIRGMIETCSKPLQKDSLEQNESVISLINSKLIPQVPSTSTEVFYDDDKASKGNESDASTSSPFSTNQIKKKGFLLKLGIKSKWPSKQKLQTTKKDEISAQEFKEMYSQRDTSHKELYASSLEIKTDNSSNIDGQNDTSSIKDSCASFQCDSDKTECDYSRTTEFQNSSVTPVRSMKPPIPVKPIFPKCIPSIPPNACNRGEPPPIPVEDIYNGCSNLQKRSGNSPTDPFLSVTLSGKPKSLSINPSIHSVSNFSQTHSILSKCDSLSRPASSASRVGCPPQVEDQEKQLVFRIGKSLSASSELLASPDCSTTGRHSPAHSEVSKTESALSPPSDLSKTESMRQLGKIEEISKVENNGSLSTLQFREPMEVKHATIVELANQKLNENVGKVEEKPMLNGNEVIKPKNEFKMAYIEKRRKPGRIEKPWYEVSDEEDTLHPQPYQLSKPVLHDSNSEDEVVPR